ncbi:putative Cytochrome P450 82A3 [Hibiscus syriacus]|uniref:Cytochrome P450 82A3 n=1 Tax=Hibiscus syriacus TaxID=106335 RepID=A0A6A2XWC2_HIBSY|nr:putative Cytochrome P450 82A3 [Hibiscus syriacus]
MADKYGPIFTIKMGVHRTLIGSDHETAKECLTIDKTIARRPSTLAMELLSYNHATFGFAPYGNLRRQMRKLATIELLSDYRLDQLRHVRQSEIKTSLNELYQLWDEKKDGSGKRIPSSGNNAESGTWKKALQQFFELWEIRDFRCAAIFKMSMILAASDTTMVTLTCAMSLLLNNRDELRKLQQELDIHVGKERLVQESDIKNLVYLKAIIKETLRLYPAGPLGVPHESMEDCTVRGYHIPAGTRLFINIAKVHRDPRVWSDPCSSPKNVPRCFVWGSSVGTDIMASVVQGFELKTPLGEAVDMSECLGMTNLKVTPLQLLITPRLPSCY